MDKHYYYTGTSYESMVPWDWVFWFHMFWEWDFLNWVWVVLIGLYFWVKWNDTVIYNKKDE